LTRIIDAWAQHPTARHMNHPMFESLRRWTRGDGVDTTETVEWPVAVTVDSMDAAGVTTSLISA
jgi:uncharacterized protein